MKLGASAGIAESQARNGASGAMEEIQANALSSDSSIHRYIHNSIKQEGGDDQKKMNAPKRESKSLISLSIDSQALCAPLGIDLSKGINASLTSKRHCAANPVWERADIYLA
jgi:hypothetical protein